MNILFQTNFLFFTCFTYLSYSTVLDCAEVKNGHFHYFTKLTHDRVEIERKDSLQIEIRPNGLELRSKITWKNDCMYNTFMNAFSTSKLSFQDSVISTIPIQFQINAVEKDYYVCTGKIESPGMYMEIRDTIYFDRVPK